MQALKYYLTFSLVLIGAPVAGAESTFEWPGQQAMAISLSYDDALDSQLDNALPALNQHEFRASFYLTLSSPTIRNRLNDWRAVADQGHELGNHSIFHPCGRSETGREWVPEHYDIDQYTTDEIVHEITVANSFLHAIDGRNERTLTPPCGDVVVSDGDYIPAVRALFVAIKGFENQAQFTTALWSVSEVSGDELIARVKAESAKGTGLLNILFHGIGAEHLAVSIEAHEQLLEYLAANRQRYWVDSYINIMSHAAWQQSEMPGASSQDQ